MKRTILFLIITLAFSKTITAQNQFHKPFYLNIEVDSISQNKIFYNLDVLFSQIAQGEIADSLINNNNKDYNKAILSGYRSLGTNKDDKEFYKKQIINFYPISKNEYWISVAYIGTHESEPPILRSIISVITTIENEKINFSIPLYYLTKDWKKKKIGNITYHYRNELNEKRAVEFDYKNTEISDKLGIETEQFDFYMTENYQEVSKLLGHDFDAQKNGRTNLGMGASHNMIFAIMNNEDFSHDILHFYTYRLRKGKSMNFTAEEGIGYVWGNAYYVDSEREMISQKQLVIQLLDYLKQNPKTSVLELFKENKHVFNDIPKIISVKSTISGVICDYIERTKGIESIKELILCGAGDENFFKKIEELAGINQSNFDKKVLKLINDYK